MKSNSSTYKGFEFEMEGQPAIAIINADLKTIMHADYPYSVFISLMPDKYNEFGHPEGEEYDLLLEAEKRMIEYLEENTRTVHVGHTTLYRTREIIFYTKDKEAVEDFLEFFLPTVEREYGVDVEFDEEWKNVSAFYELI